MPQEDQIDRKLPASRPQIKRMSLYASSADYERRLSEDCTQAPNLDVVDETHADDA
jgi:hypothetical protein